MIHFISIPPVSASPIRHGFSAVQSQFASLHAGFSGRQRRRLSLSHGATRQHRGSRDSHHRQAPHRHVGLCAAIGPAPDYCHRAPSFSAYSAEKGGIACHCLWAGTITSLAPLTPLAPLKSSNDQGHLILRPAGSAAAYERLSGFFRALALPPAKDGRRRVARRLVPGPARKSGICRW